MSAAACEQISDHPRSVDDERPNGRFPPVRDSRADNRRAIIATDAAAKAVSQPLSGGRLRRTKSSPQPRFGLGPAIMLGCSRRRGRRWKLVNSRRSCARTWSGTAVSAARTRIASLRGSGRCARPHRPTIAVHQGRVVKRTGDGSIVEFRSVVDAVALRHRSAERDGRAQRRSLGGPAIVFRIGSTSATLSRRPTAI